MFFTTVFLIVLFVNNYDCLILLKKKGGFFRDIRGEAKLLDASHQDGGGGLPENVVLLASCKLRTKPISSSTIS